LRKRKNKMDIQQIIDSVPESDSDIFLASRGLNLIKEDIENIIDTGFDSSFKVYDFATGGGRIAALLTRMGFNVATCDITFILRDEAEARITNKYMGQVEFLKENLELLSFEDNSIVNIVSANTFHHLDNPIKCLNELIRIHSGQGALLLTDFTKEGYDLMDIHHQNKYSHGHPRGNYIWEELGEILGKKYSSVKESSKSVTRSFIAKGKIQK